MSTPFPAKSVPSPFELTDDQIEFDVGRAAVALGGPVSPTFAAPDARVAETPRNKDVAGDGVGVDVSPAGRRLEIAVAGVRAARKIPVYQ
jgi:hypothetical protein